MPAGYHQPNGGTSMLFVCMYMFVHGSHFILFVCSEHRSDPVFFDDKWWLEEEDGSWTEIELMQ